MFCFIFLLGHNILGTELMAGLCTYVLRMCVSVNECKYIFVYACV